MRSQKKSHADLKVDPTRISRASYAHLTRLPTHIPRTSHADSYAILRYPSWSYAYPRPAAWDLGLCALVGLARAIANACRRVAMCIRYLGYSEPKAALSMPQWLDTLPIQLYIATPPLPPPPLSLPGAWPRTTGCGTLLLLFPDNGLHSALQPLPHRRVGLRIFLCAIIVVHEVVIVLGAPLKRLLPASARPRRHLRDGRVGHRARRRRLF